MLLFFRKSSQLAERSRKWRHVLIPALADTVNRKRDESDVHKVSWILFDHEEVGSQP